MFHLQVVHESYTYKVYQSSNFETPYTETRDSWIIPTINLLTASNPTDVDQNAT